MKLGNLSYVAVLNGEFSGYGKTVVDSIELALDSLAAGEYNDEISLFDAIAEVADSVVPVYDGEVLDQARVLADDAEECVKEGLYLVSSRNFSMARLLKCAWYSVVERGCHTGLYLASYNYMAYFLNENGADFTGDVKALEAALQEVARQADSSWFFSELQEHATEELKKWLDNGNNHMMHNTKEN